MSFQPNNYSTGIRPVGPYHPYRGSYPSAPPMPPAPPAPTTPRYPQYPGAPSGGGMKDFFQDVWAGGKEQMGSNFDKALHPVRSAKNAWQMITHPGQGLRQIAAPYQRDLASGDPGKAVGRLLANVVTIGGVVLGARALLGGGGGASVGMRGPIGSLLDGAGRLVGGVTRAVGNVVGAVLRPIGNVGRWLIGGGASVGFR